MFFHKVSKLEEEELFVPVVLLSAHEDEIGEELTAVWNENILTDTPQPYVVKMAGQLTMDENKYFWYLTILPKKLITSLIWRYTNFGKVNVMLHASPTTILTRKDLSYLDVCFSDQASRELLNAFMELNADPSRSEKLENVFNFPEGTSDYLEHLAAVYIPYLLARISETKEMVKSS